MTRQEAKSITRHRELTLRKVRSGNYRVNFCDGNETTAYYTDNLEDDVKNAVEMALGRRQGVNEASGRDGRPAIGTSDRLLERLMKVHGETRNELLKKK